MFDILAVDEGSEGTVWGPCTGVGKLRCDCVQCKHIDSLLDSGKDPDIERGLAKNRNFDKDI